MNKKTKFSVCFLMLLLVLTSCCNMPRLLPDNSLPEGFVYVKDAIPEAIIDMRYYGNDNFIGRRIDGYHAPVAILSQEATFALRKANEEFNKLGYSIKIFDTYRPQQAVNDFVIWAADPDDVKMKSSYYPSVDKKDLFAEGYIARRSGHTRGSTVDLTIVSNRTGLELDMGSPFDFFGPISHHRNDMITQEQASNRAFLRGVMENAGFRAYELEWWHYTLENEPHPDTYFDFPVR